MITIDPPIEKMTLLEKYQLIDQLEASLPKPEMQEDQHAEEIKQLLEERLAAAKRGESSYVSMDEMFERVRARVKK
jgi:putative addiction module component (TIGR02574 family)